MRHMAPATSVAGAICRTQLLSSLCIRMLPYTPASNRLRPIPFTKRLCSTRMREIVAEWKMEPHRGQTHNPSPKSGLARVTASPMRSSPLASGLSVPSAVNRCCFIRNRASHSLVQVTQSGRSTSAGASYLCRGIQR